MAMSTVVNRTSLPVFARIAGVEADVARSLIWALRRLATLVVPLMVGLMLGAGPLTRLIHDEQGRNYASAALPLGLLAAAAILRVTTQLLIPVLLGSGRPGLAARLSAATLTLLTIGIVVVGCCLPAGQGIVAVSALWLWIYPPLLVWEAIYLRRRWHVATSDLARAFVAPVFAAMIQVAVIEAARLVPIADPGGAPRDYRGCNGAHLCRPACLCPALSGYSGLTARGSGRTCSSGARS